MAFVPEGQCDRSLARSAWVGRRREPRPGGTAEVVVSPIDICRRNEVHAALETLGFLIHPGRLSQTTQETADDENDDDEDDCLWFNLRFDTVAVVGR
jgi:hypothetical protein